MLLTLYSVFPCVYPGLGVRAENGEDESDKAVVHELVGGLGPQVHDAGVDRDVGVGVVPAQHTQRGTSRVLGVVRIFIIIPFKHFYLIGLKFT